MRGKNASFFIISLFCRSIKLWSNNVQRADKSLKTDEKLESIPDHDLGNIQNATPSMHLQKQPSRGVLSKRCSENMQQIYRRIPMTKFEP